LRSYNNKVDGAISLYNGSQANNASSIYLNTFISTSSTSGWLGLGQNWMNSNFDVRCNVIIDSNPRTGSPGSGTQFDYNAYYGTGDSGENNKINKALNLRANNRSYNLGDIIRTSTNPTTDCTATADSDCFLYKVTASGTSAPTPPGYCTTLGCTTTDGSMTVQAVRGPHSLYRKLKTAPERTIIPYAMAHSSAPESRACDPYLGSRQGVGVSAALF
jgi:hypothetical protein